MIDGMVGGFRVVEERTGGGGAFIWLEMDIGLGILFAAGIVGVKLLVRAVVGGVILS